MSTPRQRVTFPGALGHDLAARLDLPAGPPKAYALFAHCFTCGKDLRAATSIAASLTDAGFAVLRFDFTGLGGSEGEFENTNFTSNVDDLVAAAAWLRAEYRAPQLLVGHSLGGAAVVVAAAQIPEVRAVATIGAPSESGHVNQLFVDSADEIEQRGAADVELAGRRFTITKQLVDDLRSGRVVEAAAELHRPLLVLHSPIDNVVGVDHAAALFLAARHPRSFVSLDGADHLLGDVADAVYAAKTIGTWAERYLVDESGVKPPPPASAPVMVSETGQGKFLNHVVVGEHRFLADEPESMGGFDAGPSPYDLLGAALGACTSMTIRMYADHKGFSLGRVTVDVSHDKVHVDDAGNVVEGRDGKIDRFRRSITVDGDLDEQLRANVLRIADKCPVHRTLERTSRIETSLSE